MFVAGLLMLYFCAGWLVKGASGLARSLGLSSLVIGLTVVAFGTSAPELVVSLISSLEGKSMIALGNAVGSNICNIALVLGITATLQPVTSSRSVIRRDIPIMLGASVLLLLFSLDAVIGRVEGAVLFSGIVLYTVMSYVLAKRSIRQVFAGPGRDPNPLTARRKAGSIEWRQIVQVVIGIVGVVEGAQFMIDSAVTMMAALGVSEKFIGLTVVAFGTSLPELATSVVAAIRKEMDISIGNLIGSNLFNILSVVGVASLVRPIEIPDGFLQSGLAIDYIVMMATSTLPLLLMRKSSLLTRRGGMVLLGTYLLYLAYLVIRG